MFEQPLEQDAASAKGSGGCRCRPVKDMTLPTELNERGLSVPGIGGTEGRWRNMGSKARKTAKYVELYEMFKKGIEEGLYAEGKYLPAERTIGETHGVGRITVRNAMELLEADGLIRRIQGAGNLVVNPQGKQVPRDARTIVFVLSGDYGEKIRQPFIEGLFHHFEIECRNNGYRLLYVSLTKDDKVLDILQDASAVSGVVFVSTVARKFVQASLEAKIPVVMISSTYDGVVSINPDNIGGCFDATEQLIHTGSRNVAFISGIVTHHNASTRLIGYKRARYCNGLGYDETMVANGDWGFESGYECMISLLQAHPGDQRRCCGKRYDGLRRPARAD